MHPQESKGRRNFLRNIAMSSAGIVVPGMVGYEKVTDWRIALSLLLK